MCISYCVATIGLLLFTFQLYTGILCFLKKYNELNFYYCIVSACLYLLYKKRLCIWFPILIFYLVDRASLA